MNAETAVTQENIESVLKGIVIPSPPQIIADLKMEMAMPEPDLNEMASMISKDPGLAGSVLKTLNSPFYGNRNISSISKAVMMLGMTTIANIVNTLYLRDSMAGDENVSDDVKKAMGNFWDSATDVARACHMVSTRYGIGDPDWAYMLGLFHNAGIPLLMQRFSHYPEILLESYKIKESRIIDTENELCKTNHAVLGFYAAKSWKLPPLLSKVISEHHNAMAIFSNNNETSSDEKSYLAVLKIGEHLASLSRIIGNNDHDAEWEQIESAVLDYIGLSQFDFADLISYAKDNGIGVQSYFM